VFFCTEEGLDINDSDCDEVIEETILSDEEGSGQNSSESRGQSRAESCKNGGTELEDAEADKPAVAAQKEEESSSDDDALSVASRYSLFEEEDSGAPQTNQRLPVRLRTGNSAAQKKEDSPAKMNSRRRSGSRNGTNRSRSRSPLPFRGPRRRRSRSRSPMMSRRRPIRRSRSRSREPVRRRSPDRDRERMDRDRNMSDRDNVRGKTIDCDCELN
jgi:hypothetical protein